MKAHEVGVGEVCTVEVKPLDGQDFGAPLSPRAEISLQFSDATGEALLQSSGRAWPIVGLDPRAVAALDRLRHRNLPRVAWLAAVRPPRAVTATAIVQVHEFPAAHTWPDAVDIGVDDKVLEALRLKERRLLSVADAIAWLRERILLEGVGGGPSRALLSGSPTPGAAHTGAFRLSGRGYAVDVARGPEDRLTVTRVVELHRGAPLDERRPIVLVHGHLRFCDATIAGAFRGTARSQLDQLVEQSGSYLHLWREYNKLEREGVRRRARAFGWLRYSSVQALPGGLWRFGIERAPQAERALDTLLAMEKAELEAATSPPLDLEDDAAAQPPGGAAAPPRPFVGVLRAADPARLTLDLQERVSDDPRSPPSSGVVYMSIGGDRTRLARREQAQALIASASCPMPQLGLLLEGNAVPERRRRTVEPLSPAALQAFASPPTAMQVEALRVALNTPDIALIQGPPGTGKTRTIAALQARLAELAEGEELSGQTLLTSYQHSAVENAAALTSVYGLPAIKVGGRRGVAERDDGFDRWRRDRVDAVRADLATLPTRPVADALRRVRTLAAAYVSGPLTVEDSTRVAGEVAAHAAPHLPPSLNDRLAALQRALSSPGGAVEGPEADDRALALKAARGLRIDEISFGDDGPRAAQRLLHRLERLGGHADLDLGVLRSAAAWTAASVPPFLEALGALQGALIDRLSAARPAGAPLVNADLERLLSEVVDALHRRARESAGGEDAVLLEYLEDLENNSEGVREAVLGYTVVLAATCQQAVGVEMAKAKGADRLAGGEDDSRFLFGNVIVDEAARANPLDLFIPMALAERRIILVGDHRQLPHILEPDVEFALQGSVAEATKAALRLSLFERLYTDLAARERADGVKRTVRLDIQYRMHPRLGAFVSDTFYAPHGEGFTSGRPAEAFPDDLPGYEGRVAAWVNIPLAAGRERGGQSKLRPAEAAWIARELVRLAEARPDLSIGVISFYKAQERELFGQLEARGMAVRLDDGSFTVAEAWRETRGADGRLKERLRVGTVDAFQGKEFDVVFLSMTRSNDLPAADERALRRRYGYLMLENRLCVAMSRQQRLLVVVGDAGMLAGPEAARVVGGLVAFRALCEGDHGVCLSA